MKPQLFITGGAGFIGSHLTDMFAEKGYKVIVADNMKTGQLDNLKYWLERLDGVKIMPCDLRIPHSIGFGQLNPKTVVLHLAANVSVSTGLQNPREDIEDNYLGTFNLLEAMRRHKCKKIVFFSSSTVYGEKPTKIIKDMVCEPISLYGATKLGCEALIRAYCELFGFKAVIMRLANIVGSRLTHGLLYDKLKEKPPRVYKGFPSQQKSYVHVTDVAEATKHCLSLLQSPPYIFNLSNDAIKLKEIATMIGGEYRFKNKQSWLGDVHSFDMVSDWQCRFNSREAIALTLNSYGNTQ